jgi:septum formation protein
VDETVGEDNGAMSRHAFIYLASQSPRRAQLLSQLGAQHQPLLADAFEDAESLEAPLPQELPADYVPRVTALKLQAALRRLRARGLPVAPVLAADTTVALGRRILGKPADADEARAMLQALSGRTHRVITSVAVASAGRRWLATSTSRVHFAVLTPKLITQYIASGEPFGKAGAYAIQSALAGWITRIDGSYSGIMGLPLCETAQLLQRAGVAMSLKP